ncbi:MAG: 16S rRNA (cytosine(967)-C(5))-methyltransferase RsmB [candidate division WOR-3 bacterium]|nr:16S rRNA (cytosine(967)-C(5))-methyltransferase RsmB [candidate division WOR-3 bacterium]
MNAREAALNALCEVEQGANLKLALGVIFEKNELSEEERALANEIAFGTARHREEIDQIIRETFIGDFNNADPVLKNILRLAVYQYLFLDRIPVYAVVNEAVKLGRSLKEKALINAVLRGIIRNKKVQSMREPQVWVLRKILEAYPEEGEKIIESFKNRPTPYIRINRLKANAEFVEQKLKEMEIEVRPANWLEDFRKINRLGSLINNSLLKQGFISIHDEAQGMICRLVAPRPGERIFDVCSAPGSKTTYMAELMNNQGLILAGEVSSARLRLVVENAERLGLTIIKYVLADGRRYQISDFDKVLVDAPCTNSGVIAKRPEVKERVNKKVLARLANLQYNLLSNAASFLRVGGSIVYSTCSILPRENEEIIERFLSENKNFELEPAKEFVPGADVYLKILPGFFNTDGIFAARLKRIK